MNKHLKINKKIRDKFISYNAFTNNKKYEICTNWNTHPVMSGTFPSYRHAKYLSPEILKSEQKELASGHLSGSHKGVSNMSSISCSDCSKT